MDSAVELLASFLPEHLKKQYSQVEGENTRLEGEDQIEREETPNITCYPALSLHLKIVNSNELINKHLDDQWDDHYGTSATQLTNKEYDIPTIITEILDIVVPIISRLGGDLLTFSGESLLAIFKLEDEETASVLLRAITCGLQLKESLHERELPHCGSNKPRILVTIAGADKETAKEQANVFCGYMGGYAQRWQLVVGGCPVAKATQMSNSPDILASGRVVVISQELWELVKNRCEGTVLPRCGVAVEHVMQQLTSPQNVVERKRPKGNVNRDTSAQLMRLLWKHVPAPAQLLIGAPGKKDVNATDSLSWMNEVRLVSILSINFTQLEYNWNGANTIQHIILYIQRIAEHYHGMIVNVIVTEDRGTTVDVAFGVPLLAREGVARAAVSSAIAVFQQHRTLLSQLQLQQKQAEATTPPPAHDDSDSDDDMDDSESKPLIGCKIGIASGHAVCAIVGSNSRRAYVVLGRVISDARKIAFANVYGAGLTMRCDPATRHLARGYIKFKKLTREIYEPLNRADTDLLRKESPVSEQLMGRNEEMNLLKERLTMLAESTPKRGGLVLLEAEAGMGKSRLMREFAWSLTTEDQTFMDGTGDIYEQGTPYYIWRKIFIQIFSMNLLHRDDGEYSYSSMSSISNSEDQDVESLLKDRSSESISSDGPRMNIREMVLKQLETFPPSVYCWTPLLGAVMTDLRGISFPEMVDLRRMKREAINEKTLEFLVYILREASKERPFVLILENFQWFDAYSWKLLSAAIKSIPSVLFVVTGRGFAQSEHVPPEYTKIMRLFASEGNGAVSSVVPSNKVSLKPLSTEESAALVYQLLRSEEYDDDSDEESTVDGDDDWGTTLDLDGEAIDFYNHSEKQLLQKSARSSIIEKVLELSQGNPLFIEELGRSIITKRRELRQEQRRRREEEYLKKGGKQKPRKVWKRSKLTSSSGSSSSTTSSSSATQGAANESEVLPHLPMMSYFLPDTILDVIATQLDSLTPEQRLLLKVASVIGSFDFKVLEGVFPPIQKQRINLRQQIELLEKYCLIKSAVAPSTLAVASTRKSLTTSRDLPTNSVMYTFKYTLVQEALYKMMLNQKTQFHQWVAEWYEKSIDDLSPLYSLLATHYSRANNISKTLHFSLHAGDKAFGKMLHEEAIHFFSVALRLVEIAAQTSNSGMDMVMLASVQRRLSLCYINYGNLKQVLEHLEKSLSLLKQPYPSSGAGNVTNLLGELLTQGWRRYKSATPSGGYAVSRDLLEAVRTYISLGEFCALKADEPTKGIFAIMRAINLMEAVAHPPVELALCYGFMVMYTGIGTSFSSLPVMYDSLMQKAIDKTKANDPSTLSCISKALYTASLYHITNGGWAKAESYLTNAMNLADSINNRIDSARSRNILALQRSLTGKLKEATKLYTDVFQIANADDHESRVTAKLLEARCMFLHKQHEETLEILDEVEPMSIPLFKPLIYGMMALCYLRTERPLVAIQIISSTFDWFMSTKPYCSSLDGHFFVLEVLLLIWEADLTSVFMNNEWKGKTKALLAKVDSYLYKIPVARPRALIFRGLYEWQQGNNAKAEKKWNEASSVAKEMGLRFDYAHALYELERHYCFTSKQFRRNSETGTNSQTVYKNLGVPPKPYDLSVLDTIREYLLK